jgi:hypothetical protein
MVHINSSKMFLSLWKGSNYWTITGWPVSASTSSQTGVLHYVYVRDRGYSVCFCNSCSSFTPDITTGLRGHVCRSNVGLDRHRDKEDAGLQDRFPLLTHLVLNFCG